jgi:RNA polymerase sigma-70 factor (ECF subfamily)
MKNKKKHFETLVRSFSSELYRFGYGLCHNSAQAEDLVQETFLRAWKSFDSLREADSSRSWLYTILRRENARIYERQRPEVWAPDTLPDIAVRGDDTSVEALVLRKQLSELKLEYREPLMLKVIAGFSTEEIGQIMDISTNAVMTRLSRARRMLRESLQLEDNLQLNTGTAP